MPFNLGETLKDAGSLLGNLGLSDNQTKTNDPPQATGSGFTTPSASSFSGGAGPSPAPPSSTPVWVYVAGGSVVLIVLILALRR